MHSIFRALGGLLMLGVCVGCSNGDQVPAPQPVPQKLPVPARPFEEIYEQRQAKLEIRVAKVMQKLGVDTELLAEMGQVSSIIAAFASADAAVQKKVRAALMPILGEAQMRPELVRFVATQLTTDHIDAVERWAGQESTLQILNALRKGTSLDVPMVKLSADRRRRIDDLVRTTQAITSIESSSSYMSRLADAIADAVDPASRATFLAANRPRSIGNLDQEEIANSLFAPALVGITDEDLDRFLQFSDSPAGARFFSLRAVSVSLIIHNLTPKIASAVARVAAVPLQEPVDGATAETLLAEGVNLLHDDGRRESLAKAMLVLKQADAAKPDDARILAELGFASVRTRGGPRPSAREHRVKSPPENFTMAREYLERAIKVDANHADAYGYLGYIEFLQYNDLEAAEQFKRARTLGSTRGWLDLQEANLAGASGRSDEAFAKYLSILKAPSAGQSARSLALQEAANLTATSGRMNEFTRASQLYISEGAASEEVLFNYARILVERVNDPDSAMAVLKRIKSDRMHRDVSLLSSIALALQASRGFHSAGGTTKASRKLLDQAVLAAGSHAQLVQNLTYDRQGVKIAEAVAQRGPKSAEVNGRLFEVAIYTQQHDLVARMLKAGANANAMDSSGNDPLIAKAAYARNIQAFGLLLEHGANPASRLHDGRTLRMFLEDVRDPAAQEMLKMLAKYEQSTKAASDSR